MPKSKGKFRCPTCRTRVGIEVRHGGWYWAVHTDPATGAPCALSGRRMA